MVVPKEFLGKRYELTRPTMLAFPQVITAEVGVQGSDPKFSAWLVFDPKNPDLKALQQVAYEVGCLRLPAKFTFCRMPLTPEEVKDPEYKAKNNPGRMSPFYLGDRVIANAQAREKAKAALENRQERDVGMKWASGKVILVTKSGKDKPPGLAAKGMGLIPADLRLSADPMFYTGALVGATVCLSVYEGFGGGVNAYLNSLYATGEGERVGNVASAIPSWANESAQQHQVPLRQQLAEHLAEPF